MASTYMSMIIMIIAIHCKSVASPSPPPPPPPPNFGKIRYYKLAIHYPISYCLTKSPPCSLDKVPQDFKIHGLWPEAIPGQRLDRSKEMFDPTIPPKVTGLRSKWINANDMSSRNETSNWIQFIKYEWEEHGTFAGLSQMEYFERAVKLYDRVEVQLKKFATPGTYINATVLRQQLEAHKLGKPGTYCKPDVRNRNRNLLVELRFIVSLDFNTFLINLYTDCQNSLMYLLPSVS